MSGSENPLDIVTPASRLLGRRWIGVDRSTGVARTAFHAPPEFANRHGIVHGGFVAAMLDSGAGFAVLDGLAPEFSMVTARLDTAFIKPTPLGPLEARAKVVARDARDVTITAELFAPDDVLTARATVFMRIVKRRAKSAPGQQPDGGAAP